MKKVRKIDVVQEEREKKKLKVVAYCRVSTKYESQKSSIDLQVSYFTHLIEKNPNLGECRHLCGYRKQMQNKRQRAVPSDDSKSYGRGNRLHNYKINQQVFGEYSDYATDYSETKRKGSSSIF